MSRRFGLGPALKLLSALVTVAGVAGLVVLATQNHLNPVISDKIGHPDPGLSGVVVLLPNLDDAVVHTPDRPSHRSELHGPNRLDNVKRRRSFHVTTNSLGLRGPEPALEPSHRILALGDSVTFGWGVDYEDSWPVLLSERLGREVVNAGMPAMSPRGIGLWAQSHAAALEPEVVLFVRRPAPDDRTSSGDFVRGVQRVRAALPNAKLGIVLPPFSSMTPGGVRWAADEARWVRSVFPSTPVLDLHPVFQERKPDTGVTLAWTGSQWSLLQQPGGDVLAQGQGDPDELPREVCTFFEQNLGAKEPLFFDDGHPDEEGLVLFAAQIATWIETDPDLR